MPAAVEIHEIRHRFGTREALKGISLSVATGEIFGLLGPNGSGKTTLFRILSTLLIPTAGTVCVLGNDVVTARARVRRDIGVVFQNPALDRQLTAAENLLHHGHLYGIRGDDLRQRIDAALSAVGLSDRARERTDKFSGGMRRRVELAKAMLTRPKVLILDEPSTGLDPAARIDLWAFLNEVRKSRQVTVLLTTHLMEEADKCDRLAVLQAGALVACDAPESLKSLVGGDVISIKTPDPAGAIRVLDDKLKLVASVVDGVLRIEHRSAYELLPRIVEALPGAVESISVSRPSLEDAFIHLTGSRFD